MTNVTKERLISVLLSFAMTFIVVGVTLYFVYGDF